MWTYPEPVNPGNAFLTFPNHMIASSASYKTPLSPIGVGLEVGFGVGMVGPVTGARVGGLGCAFVGSNVGAGVDASVGAELTGALVGGEVEMV
eukprot:CAMPEP_0195292482 /NCGR_PEP_ID=MMETSP0707-20130614/9790_1 /TAXON_ID=33640 /ORGANISM="Asterionellopsis glacialis, Strain CCMP134" /LENGTH=92 /DNA_ID=CAMNT_0040352957 /DNA_START=309 /DNA_END=583 /DNA_ORIENTATION=-